MDAPLINHPFSGNPKATANSVPGRTTKVTAATSRGALSAVAFGLPLNDLPEDSLINARHARQIGVIELPLGPAAVAGAERNRLFIARHGEAVDRAKGGRFAMEQLAIRNVPDRDM